MITNMHKQLTHCIIGISFLGITGCLEETPLPQSPIESQAKEITEGLDMNQGDFVAMSKLINEYNASEDKVKFFGELSAVDQAKLFVLLPDDQKRAVLSAYYWEAGMYQTDDGYSINFPGLPLQEMRALKAKFNEFLRLLPDGTAGPTLNLKRDLVDNTKPDLSGINLTGWDTTNVVGYYANFSGSKLTGEQINKMDPLLSMANFSNIDLSNWDPYLKTLTGVNLTGTKITGTQLNRAYSFRSANLSGLDLRDLDVSPRIIADIHQFTGNIEGVNFSNSMITAEQIARASVITNINLSNTGITRESLQAAIIAAGRESDPPTGLNTVIFD
jgi:uncharacterized protein YjbI with pentapeptide repeats